MIPIISLKNNYKQQQCKTVNKINDVSIQRKIQNNELSFNPISYNYQITFKGKNKLFYKDLLNVVNKYSTPESGALFSNIKPECLKKIVMNAEKNPNYSLKIGMTGESGSGKSTYFDEITKRLREKHSITPCVIRRDQYMNDYSKKVMEYGSYNAYSVTGDLEGSECIDFERIEADMAKLANGETVFPKKRYRDTGVVEAYDYDNPINPAKVIMIEGIALFHNEKFRKSLDLAVYCDLPEKDIKNRWMERAPSRGKTGKVAEECFDITKEKSKIYTLPHREDADLILNANASFETVHKFVDDFSNVWNKYVKPL